MKKEKKAQRKVEVSVAKALADVPVDNKLERDDLRARLRQKYSELKPLKVRMNKEDRERFDELGDIMDALEECESRLPQKRPPG
jgi:ribonuclease I